jgi:HEAT repeat protein
MIRRNRIAIALLTLAGFGLICFFALRPSEPQYEGKPLSLWIEQLLAKYPRRDAEARDALLRMGQPAVRFLTRESGNPPPKWRRRIGLLTAEIPLLNRLFGISRFNRLFAIQALAELGPAAKSAIPTLEQISKADDRMLSLAARATMIRIREEKIDSQITTYREFETTNSAQTVFLFVELGSYAKAAIPALLEGMQSTNYRVRHLAAMALPAVGYDLPEHVPSLLRLLNDPSEMVRRQALYSLADFGHPAIKALPQAREFLRDTNDFMRAAALTFFDKVLSDEEFSAVRDDVTKAEQDPDWIVSRTAKHVLAQRPHAKSKGAPGQ